MDAYNRRLDKGLSGSDVPHRLVLEALYEVPSFDNANAILRTALGGWKIGVLETPSRVRLYGHYGRQHDQRLPGRDPCGRTCCAILVALRPAATSRWFDTSAFANPHRCISVIRPAGDSGQRR